MRAVVLGLLAASASAFVPNHGRLPVLKTRCAPSTRTMMAMSSSESPTENIREGVKQVAGTLRGYVDKAVDTVKNFDSDEVQSSIKAASGNALSELNLEVKGELWAIPPFILMGLIFYGQIPVIGALAQLIAGPGLLLVGLAFVAAGIYDLGPKFSPWPQPVQGAELKKEGVYGLTRHPIYGGLLMFSFGLSVTTEEFDRLILTVLLFLTLEKLVDFEEKYLKENFGVGYEAYSQQVKKFIPFIY